MAFINDTDIANEDIYEGYVVSTERAKDTKTIVVDVVGVGEKTYVINDEDAEYSSITVEKRIIFKEKGENGIKELSAANIVKEEYTEGTAKVIDRDGKYLKVEIAGATQELVLASDVIVYEK